MKQIDGVDLNKCFLAAQQEVKEDLEAQVTKQIKDQLMAVAQLKIKANNSVTESEKLGAQLRQKEELLGKISAGDWKALPDSAKERTEAIPADKQQQQEK